MSDLRNVFDNVEHSSDKWEPYFDVYEKHLSCYRNKEVVLVEIGVQRGGSLEMWSKYLGPQATIIGLDVDPAVLDLKYEQDNITVMLGDQGDPAFWDEFLAKYPKIDILIDDGGHTMIQQAVTFEKVFPHVTVGGIFICEDTHTSYMHNYHGGLNRAGSFIERSKHYIDVLYQNWIEGHSDLVRKHAEQTKDLTSIHFYDSVVVFEKLGKPVMNRVAPKGFEAFPR